MDEIRANFAKVLERVLAQREEILEAFVAKYGCGPDEIVQVEQRNAHGTEWRVARRVAVEIRPSGNEADERVVTKVEPFVVRFYEGTERPQIKGNGFDGLEVGEERWEAEKFVKWLNERLGFGDELD